MKGARLAAKQSYQDRQDSPTGCPYKQDGNPFAEQIIAVEPCLSFLKRSVEQTYLQFTATIPEPYLY